MFLDRLSPFIFILLAWAISMTTFSQSLVNDQSLSVGANKRRAYHLGFVNTLETNLHANSNKAQKVSTNSTTLYGNYKFSSGYLLSSFFTIDQQLTQEKESILRDGVIRLDKSLLDLADNINLSLRVSATLPTSKRSRLSESRTTSLSINPRLIFRDPIPGLNGFLFILSPGITQNVHQFDSNLNGVSNVERTYSLRATGIYQLSSSFSLISDNIFQKNSFYNGATRDQYSLSQEINYGFNSNLNLGFGHSIGGSFLQNNREYNFQFFDQNQSTFYLSLNYEY